MDARSLSCPVCGRRVLYSVSLGACADCIEHNPEGRRRGDIRRTDLRQGFDLAPAPPVTPGGALCTACANRCRLGENELGFCGTKKNLSGTVTTVFGAGDCGTLDWYHDPLPTNCVASWICPEAEHRPYEGALNLAYSIDPVLSIVCSARTGTSVTGGDPARR